MFPQLITLLFFCGVATAAKIPKGWEVCKRSDPEVNTCLKKAIEGAILSLVGGNPSLGVFPIDPFHFDEIEIDQGSGPVSINLVFKNMDMMGLSSFIIDNVDAKWDEGKLEIKAHLTSDLKVNGDYTIGGKVLLLPISGTGKSDLTFSELSTIMTLTGEKIEKDSKEYFDVKTFDIKMDTKHLVVYFGNLFNGDKALGDNMNKFLNENWREVFNELKPAIGRAFGAAYKDISNRVFHKIPMNVIIPE